MTDVIAQSLLFIAFGFGAVFFGIDEFAHARGWQRATWAAFIGIGCIAVTTGALVGLSVLGRI